MKHVSAQIHHYLMSAQKIIIVPHQNPDADALGTAGALYEYLILAGRPATIFCITPIINRLRFLPHSQLVQTDPGVLTDQEVDTVIVVDSGDLRYAGVEKLLRDRTVTIINIDHHPTNEKFGDFNLVSPTASSTAEIIYYFLEHNNVRLNQRLATSLLAGIITDTDNFTNSATSAGALKVAGELLRSGGNLNLVNESTTKNQSIQSLKLWGKALSRLEKHEAMEITYTYLTQKDLMKHGVSESESDGIANFLNNLENTKISLILKETEGGKIKGSFRTTRDDVDVTALAKKFGGGGHKKAAGFTTDGTIQSVLNKILTV